MSIWFSEGTLPQNEELLASVASLLVLKTHLRDPEKAGHCWIGTQKKTEQSWPSLAMDVFSQGNRSKSKTAGSDPLWNRERCCSEQ